MQRNLPFFFLVFFLTGLLFSVFIVLQLRAHKSVPSIVPVAEEQEWHGFTGRVVMPSLDDLYVLDNSADRDLLQFEKFLKGRAAGLHWVASSHFAHEHRDVVMGIKITLDSLGHFSPDVLFSDTDDENFKSLVASHIRTYWRYPRSEEGSLEVWLPVVWKADYKQ